MKPSCLASGGGQGPLAPSIAQPPPSNHPIPRKIVSFGSVKPRCHMVDERVYGGANEGDLRPSTMLCIYIYIYIYYIYTYTHIEEHAYDASIRSQQIPFWTAPAKLCSQARSEPRSSQGTVEWNRCFRPIRSGVCGGGRGAAHARARARAHGRQRSTAGPRFPRPRLGGARGLAGG